MLKDVKWNLPHWQPQCWEAREQNLAESPTMLPRHADGHAQVPPSPRNNTRGPSAFIFLKGCFPHNYLREITQGESKSNTGYFQYGNIYMHRASQTLAILNINIQLYVHVSWTSLKQKSKFGNAPRSTTFSANVMPQVENSVPDLLWQVVVSTIVQAALQMLYKVSLGLCVYGVHETDEFHI